MSRRNLDSYETSSWQVDALVDHLPELRGRIWCPCVGDGSLLRQLNARIGHRILDTVTNDINPSRDAEFHVDAATPEGWETMTNSAGQPDWVVENPPFNVELEILRHAYRWANVGVAFMSRISFPEGTKDRGPWLANHPRIKQITLERYSFTGNGKSDSATTEWLVWVKPGVQIANPGGFTAFGYKPRRQAQQQAVEMEVAA